MKKNVLAPSVGESITEVSILKWNKSHGESVKLGEQILEIESDKATVEVVAEQAGVLQIFKQAGERVGIGAVLGEIDDALTPSTTAGAVTPSSASAGTPSSAGAAPAVSAAPKPTMPNLPPLPGSAPSVTPMSAPPTPVAAQAHSPSGIPSLSPATRRASLQMGVDPSHIAGTGKDGRVTKGDILQAAEQPRASTPAGVPTASVATPAMPAPAPAPAAAVVTALKPGQRRVPMSMLRQKIAERLVHAQHTAAILTTFNEVDMAPVNALRNQYKDAFKAKHGVPLSYMSFFARASVLALKAVPEVNAMIEGKDIIYNDYCDLGIAVGTERGLVVPVVRGAEKMTFLDIEKAIAALALKAREGKLSIPDLTGGTFTISNGGTYGSLMSTPILNPPQSGILGMHKIMDRPVVVNGKIEVRPMMYLALSYDHRIIDGKGAVTFLVTLKDVLENPEKLGFEGV